MSYKVLYRKYRPSNFSDIIDQKFITDTLKESIINNKISHAYIFSGPKGTGKTSTAKVFAKAINCENPIDGEPCDKCESCKNFDRSADIIELDAASNNKVEDIREIVNNVKLAPTSSKFKIYVIDEVHMLTPSAANAFLLTLEEPPSHVVFILATTNPESLPSTILSRCQQFAFSKISKKAVISRIEYVLNQEGMTLDKEVISEIADLADGGLRDALSILDQLITLNKPINVELLTEQFGVVSESIISSLVENIVELNINKINDMFISFKEYGYNEKSFIYKLIAQLSNKICELKANNDESMINSLKNIIFEIIKIDNIKTNFNYYDVIKMIIITNISPTETNIISKEIKLIEEVDDIPKNEETPDIKEEKNISQEINLEKKIENNLQDVNINDNKDLISIRINNSFVKATKSLKLDLESKLSSIFDSLKRDKNIYSLIIDTELGVVSPTNILIVCDTEAAASLLNEKADTIKKKTGLEKTFVFVDRSEWKKIVDKFTEDKNNKIKYTYIEEPAVKKDKSDIENIANTIFDENNLIVEE